MSRSSIGVGVLGCGQISATYLRSLASFPVVRVVACADVNAERAAQRAEEHSVPKACTPDELLADPEVELVLNLTWHRLHAELSLAAIAAGKSVYSEKPLASKLDDGRAVVEAARAAGVRVGIAPSTFLSAAAQTCRALIDEGAIGEPIAATALILEPGPDADAWDPTSYYGVGAGPLFDMGPYFLTSLVNLLGPARRVTGSAPRRVTERVVTAGPRAGQTIPVEVPTHAAATIDFASGPVATLVASYDVRASNLPSEIEIYGTEGTLSVPDPNWDWGGTVRIGRSADDEWEEIPLRSGPTHMGQGWAIGVADMARAMLEGRQHSAAGEIGLHVLEIMEGVHASSESGRHVELTTSCERPATLPADWDDPRA